MAMIYSARSADQNRVGWAVQVSQCFLTSYRPVTADVWAQRNDRLARRSARGVGESAMSPGKALRLDSVGV
jgi:hypothetical protein